MLTPFTLLSLSPTLSPPLSLFVISLKKHKRVRLPYMRLVLGKRARLLLSIQQAKESINPYVQQLYMAFPFRVSEAG